MAEQPRELAAPHEAARLRHPLDKAEESAPVARPEPGHSRGSPPLAAPSAPSPHWAPRRMLRRAAAVSIWRLLRPIARPLLWRARTFFMADALRELAELGGAQQAMLEAMLEAQVERRSGDTASPAAPCRVGHGAPGEGLGLGDTAAERWLLTVALESAQARQSLESAQARESLESAPNAQAA
jgi:hypothetical protein